MKARYVGLQEINFENEKGVSISGKNAYFLWEDENVVGLKAGKFFIKDNVELPNDIKFNDFVDLTFTMKGKIERISKV